MSSYTHTHEEEQQADPQHLTDMLQVFQQRMANHVSNYELQIASLNAELAKSQRKVSELEKALDKADAKKGE